MFRIPTNHRNKCKEEHDENQDHLSSGKPEFSFTVPFHRKSIQNTRELSQQP